MSSALFSAPSTAVPSSVAALVQPPAMLLAAGRGERMRPLTDHCPKPLLEVQGQPLLQWHLQALAAARVPRAVINTGWLGAQIPRRLGSVFDAAGAQLPLIYSDEDPSGQGSALETAGGIARALPQLGPVFWLAAGDVFAPDFTFDATAAAAFTASDQLAHLWLVANPEHHPQGDFGLSEQGLALDLPEGDARPRWTYSTIALLRAELFSAPWCALAAGNPEGERAALGPLLRRAMAAGRVGASVYSGRWTDVGTPERLARLNAAAA